MLTAESVFQFIPATKSYDVMTVLIVFLGAKCYEANAVICMTTTDFFFFFDISSILDGRAFAFCVFNSLFFLTFCSLRRRPPRLLFHGF